MGELRAVHVPTLFGHLSCWDHFLSIDLPQNKKFVKRFKQFGKEQRLI
ncbi:transporter substrate-binding protein [Gimesia panareensis]